MSDTPPPTWVPDSAAPKAAAEPISATAPTSIVHRRGSGDVEGEQKYRHEEQNLEVGDHF